MDFGEVLSRAWQITWKYKILWLFGILASCGRQAGSNSANYSFDQRDFDRFNRDVPLPPGLRNLFFGLQRWFEGLTEGQIVLFIALITIVVLVLFVLGLFLSTAGRIGLIQGALEADQGASALTFGGLFSSVRKFFWRNLGLNLLLSVLIIAVVLIFVLFFVVSAAMTLGIALICLLPLLCLVIPIGWFVGVIIEQANVALVVDDLRILDALSRGWQVVRENLGSMILMGLILTLGVGLIGGIIINLPMLLVVFPVLFGFIAGTGEAIRSSLLIAGICFVIYLPVLIVLSGILQAYISSSWTLTYLRLTGVTAQGIEVIEDVPPVEGA